MFTATSTSLYVNPSRNRMIQRSVTLTVVSMFPLLIHVTLADSKTNYSSGSVQKQHVEVYRSMLMMYVWSYVYCTRVLFVCHLSKQNTWSVFILKYSIIPSELCYTVVWRSILLTVSLSELIVYQWSNDHHTNFLWFYFMHRVTIFWLSIRSL